MKIRFVISLFLLIAFGQSSQAQSYTKKAQSPFIKARAIMDTDPQQAIAIIREHLNGRAGRGSQNFEEMVEAHVLLGDIYQQIGQMELAAERYNQAFEYSSGENIPIVTRQMILEKEGNTLLTFDLIRAKKIFRQCLSLELKSGQNLICLEGLADVLLKQDSVEKSINIFKNLELTYEQMNKTEDVIRIQSKMTTAYAKEKEFIKSQYIFTQAYENLKTTKGLNEKNSEAYRTAKEINVATQNSNQEKIDFLQKNIEVIKNSPESRAEEQLNLADIYLQENEDLLALNTLLEAKKSIEHIDAPDIKARLNKKTSSIYFKNGDYQEALSALTESEAEQQKSINQKLFELDQQINIVKTQQLIDLDEKEFSLNSSRLDFQKTQLQAQKYIIGLLSLLLVIAGISIYIILKNVRGKKRANKLLELKGLRSQMNPHFLFNSLNTVNEYIMMQDERNANKYLSDFSALMRLVLENSKRDLITIHEEIETTQIYLELEHRRFSDKFDFEIQIDPELNRDVLVPPLLLQPYLENAIWHGLRYKEKKGDLFLGLKQISDMIEIEISDNGIGRQKSKEMKTKHQKTSQSTAMNNTKRRMDLINDVYKKNISLQIRDLNPQDEYPGTKITITIEK